MSRGGRAARPRGPLYRVFRIAVFSAAAGAAYAAATRGTGWVGGTAGALTGGVLAFLELFVLGGWARAILLRAPFAIYFGLRIALYCATVFAILELIAAASGRPLGWRGLEERDVQFAFAMCVLANLLISVNELLGRGVLFAFAAGRYRRPRREQRVLLYIDLCGSTGLAERLGEVRFLDLLNEFFADVTTEIVARGGEIHKYVGDEVIAVWREESDPGEPIGAALAARTRLAARAAAYRAAFGETPEFRAAIHAGPVVIGELGAQKKEIALIGDAMNTAARILDAGRERGAAVLVSAPFYERLARPPPGVAAERLEPIALRGKSAPLPLISLKIAT